MGVESRENINILCVCEILCVSVSERERERERESERERERETESEREKQCVVGRSKQAGLNSGHRQRAKEGLWPAVMDGDGW